MIACIIIAYAIVTLGALRIVSVMYRDDVAHSARHRLPTPKRYQYFAPAVGWPVIWVLVPVIVLVVGALDLSEGL